jgi:carbonic anhydrase/acetyltransferase-like protein (isoleucine patch superfamily)
MKIGRVDIGAQVLVGARTTVLYDSQVGDGALLGPLSLVMKGEHIPPRTQWNGSPCKPWTPPA